MNINRPADVEKGKGKKGWVDVTERHDIHTVVVLAEAEIDRIDEKKGDVWLMGAYYSLGFSGGAGGVD